MNKKLSVAGFIIPAVMPTTAQACSLIIREFSPLPSFWPVLFSAVLTGVASYGWLKNYPRKEAKKLARPVVAGVASIPVGLAMGGMIFLFWPGHGELEVCPAGWKLTARCICVSPEGQSQPVTTIGPLKIDPKRRLNMLLHGAWQAPWEEAPKFGSNKVLKH